MEMGDPERGLGSCTHGDDEAVHGEVVAWAETWATTLRAEAPPRTSDGGEHARHVSNALFTRRWEIYESKPERARGCALATFESVERIVVGADRVHLTCTHPESARDFHPRVLAWAKEWVERMRADVPQGDTAAHFTYGHGQIWGAAFLAERPEHFRGCSVACRAFVEAVLLSLTTGEDPAALLVYEDAAPTP